MIEGKTIKFGYGDVIVRGSLMGYLGFQQFKPPAKCGESMAGKEYETVGQMVKFDLTVKDCVILEQRFKDVQDRKIDSFEFGDYIFDFTNFNSESIRVCIEQLNHVMTYLYMLMAC